MIKSFADKRTQALYLNGSSDQFPSSLVARALRKLDAIDQADRVEDLQVPPSNRLHKLLGSRAGQFSISINRQWRICFAFVDSDAFDVEVCDYH